MVDFSIVIPYYNEEGNVKRSIDSISEGLKGADFSYEIIAVANGSLDSTPEKLKEINKKNKKVKIVSVKKNQGYGYGIKKGLEAAKGEIIGYMWADDYTNSKELVRLYHELDDKKYTLVKISRARREDTVYRLLQSKVYNTVILLMFGIRSIDLNGCPKLFRNSFFKTTIFKSDDWFLDAEIMLKLKDKRLKFKEIEVSFEKRKHGKSHVKWNTCIEFMKNMLRYKLNKF